VDDQTARRMKPKACTRPPETVQNVCTPPRGGAWGYRSLVQASDSNSHASCKRTESASNLWSHLRNPLSARKRTIPPPSEPCLRLCGWLVPASCSMITRGAYTQAGLPAHICAAASACERPHFLRTPICGFLSTACQPAKRKHLLHAAYSNVNLARRRGVQLRHVYVWREASRFCAAGLR